MAVACASFAAFLDTTDLVAITLKAAAPEAQLTFPVVCRAFRDAERRCRNMLWMELQREEFVACFLILRERERTHGRHRAWLDGQAEVAAVRRAAAARSQSSGLSAWLYSASTSSWTSPWMMRASSAFAGVSAMLDALAPRRFCVLVTGLRGAGKSAVLSMLARTSVGQVLIGHAPSSAMLDRDPQIWPPTTTDLVTDLGNRDLRVNVCGSELQIDELPIHFFGERVEDASPRLHLSGADVASAARYVSWKLPQFDAVVYVASPCPASAAPPEWHMIWDRVLGRHLPRVHRTASAEHADASALAKLLECPELRELPLLVVSPKQDTEHAIAPSVHLGALGLLRVNDRPWRLQGSSAISGAQPPKLGVVRQEGIEQGFKWLVGILRSRGPKRQEYASKFH